ncbi:hypothetical protein NXV86_02220 [Bacteroides sp. BFG-257]|jgi:hypothetical protein|uniref:hypothetical protein n=1 Tax=Bacteroides TaxID=816 RepID=UPI001CCBC746|nr:MULTISPECIES: hypothetical protein [Bacteroides]UBD70253.1 hypothetical protein K6V21_02135 [Bacteroides cellulosilyticus]UVO98882.1 hypothetical protein NXV86_02220 [Bacteroides sp. BFG-257]
MEISIIRKISLISVFLSLFFFLCFPQITLIGSALYNIFLYLNVLLAFMLHEKIGLDQVMVRKVHSMFRMFFFLSFLGNIMSILFYDIEFYFVGIKNIILIVFYGYSFAILACDKKIENIIKKCVYISSVIVSLYTIYCYVTDSNPYMLFVASFTNDLDYIETSLAEVRGLKGRVGGHLGNPVFLGGELLVLLGYCLVDINQKVKIDKGKLCVILMLLISIVLTGSRSALVPAFALLLFSLYYKYKFKSLLILSVLVLVIIPFIPNIDDFLSSLDVMSRSEDVVGSSIFMREEQFRGLQRIVGNNEIFGNGLGWIRHYINLHGLHPVLLGFESLIFSSYTEGGMWGLFVVYPFLFYSFFKLSRLTQNYTVLFYLIAYFAYALLTGAFSLKVFIALFVAILVTTKNDYE